MADLTNITRQRDKIALDIDGVLADFTYSWRRLGAKHFDIEVYSCGGQLQWDFKDLTQPQENRLWRLIDDNDFWRNMYPLVSHGEIEHLRAVSQEVDIAYVTSRKDRGDTAEQTREWLQAHGFPNADQLYQAREKAPVLKGIGATTLLDDNPRHLDEVTEAGIDVWVRDWPYNRDHGEGLPRVGSLSEFLGRYMNG